MIKLDILTIFGFVAGGALVGMVLGGVFGYAAGTLAPDIFTHTIPWEKVEPVGTATVLCAGGGVFCGAALAAFAILVQAVVSVFSKKGGRSS